jgi:hypothetical protein
MILMGNMRDEWLLDFAPNDDELKGGGRRYRGCRRAARHGPIIPLLAVLVVVALVLLVFSAVSRHTDVRSAVGTAGTGSSAGTAPTTYQADAPANTLFGTARPLVYPGASDGVVVQTIGNWGTSIGEGALRVNDVIVASTGVYAVTVYYVFPYNEPTRSMVITASGSGSVSVTVAGNSTCCSSQLVRLELNKGANSITFSNPTGHAPAIDRIVIGPALGPALG